ncbi:hypothetical protein O181_015549 [Austropuccinia psidii MF-1]|uniref:Uncharacterized protein n=1 Tax=Austropuccinia psidii MF-1 TaxID=1389203 RepID=A0A9Q3C278_9BASI|nr:hypothetical protein [Austropuccinia psidii MF-1]
MIAATATQLYFEGKQLLIKEVSHIPQSTVLCTSIDGWTTKDQSQSYLAIVMQWIDPLTYSFRKTLVAFERMLGMHTGVALACTLWEALAEQGMIKQLYCITGDNAANNMAMTTVLQEKFAIIGIQWPKNKRFHRCTCHVLNLVAKEFLAYMGQLTDEYYKFFDNYLGLKQAPIDDSNDEGLSGSVVLHNKSGDVAYLVDQAFEPEGIEADQTQSQTSSDKMDMRILRELCSRIRGSTKQRVISTIMQ